MNQLSQDTPTPRVVSVRTVDDLRGPAGRLEAVYTPGVPGALYAVTVAHPHPLFGGTMHNKVVYHAAKAFQHFGLPVLRFNFRGVGASEGRHDRGDGEQQDLASALDWLERETGLPIIAAGFSFGAWVTLKTCCGAQGLNPEVRGVVALGLPIRAGDRAYSYEFLAECGLRKLFISGSADEFGPVPAIEAAFALAAAPAQLVFIAGADHFFQGTGVGLEQMKSAIRSWLEENFLVARGEMEAQP